MLTPSQPITVLILQCQAKWDLILRVPTFHRCDSTTQSGIWSWEYQLFTGITQPHRVGFDPKSTNFSQVWFNQTKWDLILSVPTFHRCDSTTQSGIWSWEYQLFTGITQPHKVGFDPESTNFSQVWLNQTKWDLILSVPTFHRCDSTTQSGIWSWEYQLFTGITQTHKVGFDPESTNFSQVWLNQTKWDLILRVPTFHRCDSTKQSGIWSWENQLFTGVTQPYKVGFDPKSINFSQVWLNHTKWILRVPTFHRCDSTTQSEIWSQTAPLSKQTPYHWATETILCKGIPMLKGLTYPTWSTHSHGLRQGSHTHTPM